MTAVCYKDARAKINAYYVQFTKLDYLKYLKNKKFFLNIELVFTVLSVEVNKLLFTLKHMMQSAKLQWLWL